MALLLLPTVFSFRRWRAAGVHLAISCVIAALAAALIYQLWFPEPLGAIAGGTDLFVLLMTVDVVAGPALTFVVASPGKPVAELRRDLIVIGMLQASAFGYGMYAISEARPVVVSYEIDRFRVVSAADVDKATLVQAPEALRQLSWTGPKQIAAVKPGDPDELLRSIQLGMSGIDLSMVPRNWRSYETQAPAAWAAAKPLRTLLARYPAMVVEAERIALKSGQPVGALRYLPFQSRRTFWVAVLSKPGAKIVGYLPADGFF